MHPLHLDFLYLLGIKFAYEIVIFTKSCESGPWTSGQPLLIRRWQLCSQESRVGKLTGASFVLFMSKLIKAVLLQGYTNALAAL